MDSGLFLIFSVLTLPVLLVIYIALIFPTKNIMVKSLSRSSLGLIVPSYILLGYLAFSSYVSKNELENKVDIIPYSKFKNLEPLWLFSETKIWTYSSNKSARSALEFYKNKSIIKKFKYSSECGPYCLSYINKTNNQNLTIKISSLGNAAFIKYHIKNSLL